MKKSLSIKVLCGLLCLLACSGCAQNATDFIAMSGYDAQGVRTGSVLNPPGTLTPY